jgi:basic membrane protein A
MKHSFIKKTQQMRNASSLWSRAVLSAACLLAFSIQGAFSQTMPHPPASSSHPESPIPSSAPIKPVILYGMGGKFDQSFGYNTYLGAEQFKKDTGITYREFEPQNEAQIEQAMRRFLRDGYSPIIVTGFEYANILEKMAPSAPNTQFVIIDYLMNQPNVQSIVFKDHEGAFLVGTLAALASKTGTIGFIGGMDTPLIRRFSCGYAQGAHYAKKNIHILKNMIGATPSAWNDPVKGAELANTQMDQGADVIFQASGGSGVGILRAVADAKRLGIGVDTNQNSLFPGHILTSMLKRIDRATYKALSEAQTGRWHPGVVSLGIEEQGVEWAFDEYNTSLITPEMQSLVRRVESDIRSGVLKVHDYTTDNQCPNSAAKG